jgi:hypothetical protein
VNTLDIDLSGIMNDGDKLYVFNEQCNGNKQDGLRQCAAGDRQDRQGGDAHRDLYGHRRGHGHAFRAR